MIGPRRAGLVPLLAASFACAATVALGGAGSATVARGSAGAPLSVSLAGPGGSTTTTVTIAADGTYKADFGISSFDDYTATLRRSDGTTLASVPIKVTQAAESCITPTAGTGTDWGVTHSPFPFDPRFPSYVTICGRVALATTGNSSTPAGSPPSLGTPGSVTRGDASGDSGRSDARSNDDGSDFPWIWIVVVIVVVGVGVMVVILWRRSHDEQLGSMDPDDSDDPPPESGPEDGREDGGPGDEPPTPTPDVM